jgi:hypothetical protein
MRFPVVSKPALVLVLLAVFFVRPEETAEAHWLQVSLVAQHSGKCIAIGAGNRDNGAPAIQFTCQYTASHSARYLLTTDWDWIVARPSTSFSL